MRMTAVKLDGGKVTGYSSVRIRWTEVPGRWLRMRRAGYFTRFEVG